MYRIEKHRQIEKMDRKKRKNEKNEEKKEQEQQISNLVNREIHTRELLLSLKSSMLPKE